MLREIGGFSQRALRVLRQRVDELESLAHAAKELPARVGEAQAAIDAPEERLSELVFEDLDLATDRRLRERQFVGRAGEAEMTRRAAASKPLSRSRDSRGSALRVRKWGGEGEGRCLVGDVCRRGPQQPSSRYLLRC